MNDRIMPSLLEESQQSHYEMPAAPSCRTALPPAPRKSSRTARNKRRKAAEDDRKGISILLIDDNRLFRMGLSALLRNQSGLKLLAVSGKPEHVLRRPNLEQAPDVVLLDLGLGERGSHHVHNILEKLSLRSRVEVAVRGRTRGPLAEN